MITKDNEPIYKQLDLGYCISVNGSFYAVRNNDPAESYTIEMVESYLATHPEALIPEPTPPEPTPEELIQREESQAEADEAEKDRLFGRAFRLAAEAGEVDPVAATVRMMADRVEMIKK